MDVASFLFSQISQDLILMYIHFRKKKNNFKISNHAKHIWTIAWASELSQEDWYPGWLPVTMFTNKSLKDSSCHFRQIYSLDCSLFRHPRTVASFRSPAIALSREWNLGMPRLSIASAYLPSDVSTEYFTWGTWVLTASFLMEQKGFAPLESFLVLVRFFCCC